jgi:hypothetical protein
MAECWSNEVDALWTQIGRKYRNNPAQIQADYNEYREAVCFNQGQDVDINWDANRSEDDKYDDLMLIIEHEIEDMTEAEAIDHLSVRI